MSSQQFLLSFLIKTTRRFSDSIKSYYPQGIISFLFNDGFVSLKAITYNALFVRSTSLSIDFAFLCFRFVKCGIVNLLSYSCLGRVFLGTIVLIFRWFLIMQLICLQAV